MDMISLNKAVKKQEKRLEELKEAWIEKGRNQVLYLLLCLGDENVAHDNWHPDRAQVLIDARKEIVKRLKRNAPYYPALGGEWPTEYPDFETYSCVPG